jgi:phosphoribosylformylglycinamidine synthase
LVLGGDAPVYVRESKEPEYLKTIRELDEKSLAEPNDLNEVLLKLLATPNITNKNWVYEQYDTQVRTNTVIMPGGDASVVRIKETKKALAMKTDCNGRYVYLNPYKGAMAAVCEAARNVACTGAEPLAITNCLNFGNPYKPEVYYQFREAIRGIGDACRRLNTPVTGGNVSFYNESPDYAVYPTPTIGMVGLIDDVENMITSYFKNSGDKIAIIGNIDASSSIGGSEYLSMQYGLVKGDAPELDLETEAQLIASLGCMAKSKVLKSAHDISDGGFATAIAEACIMNRTLPIGCTVNIDYTGRKDNVLFNEAHSRVIISYDEENEQIIKDICKEHNIGFQLTGTVGGENIRINDDINITLENANKAYYNSISSIMEE